MFAVAVERRSSGQAQETRAVQAAGRRLALLCAVAELVARTAAAPGDGHREAEPEVTRTCCCWGPAGRGGDSSHGPTLRELRCVCHGRQLLSERERRKEPECV